MRSKLDLGCDVFSLWLKIPKKGVIIIWIYKLDNDINFRHIIDHIYIYKTKIEEKQR